MSRFFAITAALNGVANAKLGGTTDSTHDQFDVSTAPRLNQDEVDAFKVPNRRLDAVGCDPFCQADGKYNSNGKPGWTLNLTILEAVDYYIVGDGITWWGSSTDDSICIFQWGSESLVQVGESNAGDITECNHYKFYSTGVSLMTWE